MDELATGSRTGPRRYSQEYGSVVGSAVLDPEVVLEA